MDNRRIEQTGESEKAFLRKQQSSRFVGCTNSSVEEGQRRALWAEEKAWRLSRLRKELGAFELKESQGGQNAVVSDRVADEEGQEQLVRGSAGEREELGFLPGYGRKSLEGFSRGMV